MFSCSSILSTIFSFLIICSSEVSFSTWSSVLSKAALQQEYQTSSFSIITGTVINSLSARKILLDMLTVPGTETLSGPETLSSTETLSGIYTLSGAERVSGTETLSGTVTLALVSRLSSSG